MRWDVSMRPPKAYPWPKQRRLMYNMWDSSAWGGLYACPRSHRKKTTPVDNFTHMGSHDYNWKIYLQHYKPTHMSSVTWPHLMLAFPLSSFHKQLDRTQQHIPKWVNVIYYQLRLRILLHRTILTILKHRLYFWRQMHNGKRTAMFVNIFQVSNMPSGSSKWWSAQNRKLVLQCNWNEVFCFPKWKSMFWAELVG
jgi:hypothetical protein